MSNLVEILKKEVQSLKVASTEKNVGKIVEIGDGIIKAEGLSDVAFNELVSLPNGLDGLALNLEEDSVGIVVFGDYKSLKEGDEVKTTGKLLSIPVSENLIGRVVDSLGKAQSKLTNPTQSKKLLPVLSLDKA